MSKIQQHSKIVIPVALAVIALAVASMFRDATPGPIQEQIDLYYEVMALRVVRVCEALPPEASVALLANQSELDKREFKGMIRRLKKMGLTVLHIKGVSDSDDAEWGDQMGFPYRDFLRVAEEHPNLNAIISLCGTPFWPKEAALPDPSSLPDLLVTGDIEMPHRLNRMLAQDLVTSALVPREDPGMEDATDAAQLLDRDYEMLYGPSS